MDVGMSYADLGSTDFGNMVPRERFSYWCFDLLFLICSDVTRGSNPAIYIEMKCNLLSIQIKKILEEGWQLSVCLRS
jgi:hypothetical protein